LVSWWRSG